MKWGQGVATHVLGVHDEVKLAENIADKWGGEHGLDDDYIDTLRHTLLGVFLVSGKTKSIPQEYAFESEFEDEGYFSTLGKDIALWGANYREQPLLKGPREWASKFSPEGERVYNQSKESFIDENNNRYGEELRRKLLAAQDASRESFIEAAKAAVLNMNKGLLLSTERKKAPPPPKNFHDIAATKGKNMPNPKLPPVPKRKPPKPKKRKGDSIQKYNLGGLLPPIDPTKPQGAGNTAGLGVGKGVASQKKPPNPKAAQDQALKNAALEKKKIDIAVAPRQDPAPKLGMAPKGMPQRARKGGTIKDKGRTILKEKKYANMCKVGLTKDV